MIDNENEFFKAIYIDSRDVLRLDPRWDKRQHTGYIIYRKSDDTYVTSKDGFFLTFANIKGAVNYIKYEKAKISFLLEKINEMILLGYKNAKADK